MSRDLIRILLPALLAVVLGTVLVVTFRATVLWGVLLVLYLGCAGILIGSVLGREN
jgi:hypothetical protein